jgi:hypothetical protein
MINAFSQLGNIAGSYVWNMKENGYRKSYGVVTAMAVITIAGCYIFRTILVNLNEKLEAGEAAWETNQTAAQKTEMVQHIEKDVSLDVKKGFRYLI